MTAGTEQTADRGQTTGQVVVAGGGLAGIATALRLADRGRRVHLLESRPRLGGATASFSRGGLEVDTGQHVLLACYQRYLGLLARLGTADLVQQQDRLDIPVLLPGGRLARLRRSRRLPAPVHLVGALARYAALSPAERFGAGLAALALRRLDPDDPELDRQSFGDWLRRAGQSDRAVARLWGLVCVAALNTGPNHASLALAARVFRTGLLDNAAGGDIGVPRVSLAALHGEPAARALDRAGVQVTMRARVRAVVPDRAGFSVRTDDGQFAAAQVVLAVPHPQAADLVPAAACPDAARWAGLGSSAILNAHLVFDRNVTDLAFAAAPQSPVQWVFDKTEPSGLSQGQYLVTSVSDADALHDVKAADVLASQLAALADLLPGVRAACAIDSFVTREPRATFRQAPGSGTLRPPPRTRLPGLVLAGAWTATGWPDTMEGAVRSGEAAADALLSSDAGAVRLDAGSDLVEVVR